MSGRKPPTRLGIKHSEATKLKMKISRSVPENHYNWKGGKSLEQYSGEFTNLFKFKIRERDGFICKICGKIPDKVMHDVHHIDYNKKNCNINNLITLCRQCHMKTNDNRNYWIEYFKKYGNNNN